VADMPTPADLVRRLTTGGDTAARTPPRPNSNSPGDAPSVAVKSNGAADPGAGASSLREGSPERVSRGGDSLARVPIAEPAPVVSGPRFASFRDVVALAAERKEAMLHAHLLHSVHLVRFAPPVIELRPRTEAPRDLASKVATLLSEATGTRWTIAVSAAAGEATLAEQGNAAHSARRAAAADHPLVRSILEAFPGARIDTVHDRTTDAYGLPAEIAAVPDMPEFAPPDAVYPDEDPMEIDP